MCYPLRNHLDVPDNTLAMDLIYFIALQWALRTGYAESSTDNSSRISNPFVNLFVNEEMPKSGAIPLLNRKVFRGARVTIREHPYVVSVRRMFGHYLTGSLLTKNVVITAAHPIYQVPVTELKVIAGENYCDRGTTLMTVVLVIIHELFDAYSLDADLALLRTYEDMVFKPAIKTISLVSPFQLLEGRTSFVTGWGRCDITGKEVCLPRTSTFYKGELMDTMLRTIKFTIKMPNEYCEPYHRDMKLTTGMMCLGDARSKDYLCPCMAVPGAPMVVDSHLAGIQSWGFGCGYVEDMPIVYTSLQTYQPWLLHNIPMLRNISKPALTKIFYATKAQMLYHWLVKTRLLVPHLKDLTDADQIQPLHVDVPLSKLSGSVYDVRDFINAGKYHNSKKAVYEKLRSVELAKQYYDVAKKVHGEPFLGADVLRELGLDT